MCGRSTLHDAPTNILERFSLPPVLPGFVARYNIAPSQQQWTIARDRRGVASARQMRWGLVPYWAKDPSVGNRMVNARAESLTEKPSYRVPLQTQRCLVLADGYYEWKSVGRERTPMYFRLNDGRAFGLAGLWDRWHGGEATLETCTVITTAAGTRASSCHHRMPVLLVDDAATKWMDGSLPEKEVLGLLRPYDSEELQMYEVGRFVNNPANDSAECIRRADELSIAAEAG
jgi:putative SOS response-associated peptidase YedK